MSPFQELNNITAAINALILSAQGDDYISAQARVYPLFCTQQEYINQCKAHDMAVAQSVAQNTAQNIAQSEKNVAQRRTSLDSGTEIILYDDFDTDFSGTLYLDSTSVFITDKNTPTQKGRKIISNKVQMIQRELFLGQEKDRGNGGGGHVEGRVITGKNGGINALQKGGGERGGGMKGERGEIKGEGGGGLWIEDERERDHDHLGENEEYEYGGEDEEGEEEDLEELVVCAVCVDNAPMFVDARI